MENQQDKYEKYINMASRCLNCKNPRCQEGCPIGTNIPKFIEAVKNNDFIKAYNILQENNFMSEICCRICPTELQCIGNCVRGIKSEPVEISELEGFVNDWAIENDITLNIEREIKTENKKVAIVGSGPAGLFCAWELAKKGYKIDIFEECEKIGGLLRYGIPEFRLNRDLLDECIEKLQEFPIEFHTNMALGKDIKLEDLAKEYNAIFLAIGAELSNKYSLGIEEGNIITAKDLLYRYSRKENIEIGETAVIGGGNVAMDAARAAKDLNPGKEVYVIYRRDIKDSPARKIEIEEAKEFGIKIIDNTKVIKACKNGDKIEKIVCIKTEEKEGRTVDIQNSEFELNVDTVVFAIGQKPNKNIVKDIEFDGNFIKVNEKNMTNIKGVFAGGDVIGNKSTVCKAIASAKKAAREIDNYLKGE